MDEKKASHGLVGVSTAQPAVLPAGTELKNIEFINYRTEAEHLPLVQRLCEQNLSEPYSVFTYRYFINNWPDLCWLVCMACTMIPSCFRRDLNLHVVALHACKGHA